MLHLSEFMKGTHRPPGAFAKQARNHAPRQTMTENLRSLLLALALTGATAFAGASLSGPIRSARAQSAAPPVQPPPCESTTPGAAGRDGCQSNGIIRPPTTGDQGGVITPPDSSKAMPMPVIPPPGSPGGNPSIQPK